MSEQAMAAAAGGIQPGGSKRKHSELSGMLEIKEKELQWRMAEAARIEEREAHREMTDEKSRRNSLVMELIMQGKILYWGTSEWSAQEIMEAHMVAQRYNLITPIVEQPQYNMLVRDKVEVEYKQIYKTVGLGTTIWSPLASGLLTGKYLNNPESSTRLQRNELDWLAERLLTPENHLKVQKLHAFAQEIGVSLPHLGIAWCLKNPNVSTVILGASKEEQLIENLKAPEILPLLTDEVMQKIETILENAPIHPQY
jgi:aryl-alcohol dehydrogenase-like predicted oxidoreductase